MHELLLFASVPASHHHDLLQQLAGFTAMQPRRRLERRLVFKAPSPRNRINPRLGGGGSQDLQQSAEVQRLSKMLANATYYTQLVGLVTEADFGTTSTDDYDVDSQLWRMEWRDIPDAGTRSAVTSRVMSTVALPPGDIVTPMRAWGYSYETEYVVEGDVFIYNDVVLFLHRVLNFPDEVSLPEPRRFLPPLQNLSPLDKSGAYILQASVTVQDGSNPDLVKEATQHLFNVREQLKTTVRLEQGDRLSLDTRVK